ncbi:hypothetical protein [Gimesia chilikensis]|uniref:hypothetical protein n=1 Tax=Gimesia chilikensis TaxID=2605989 RepID=UPI00118D0393|nr:hypothetical protein [Gimesia chilikensis]QDT84601.1 hypothetical protein MalM14_22610 [Gimesia chilikensis]
MNIQDFISTAITEIVAGVSDANKSIQKYQCTTGSHSFYGGQAAANQMTDNHGRLVTMIDFDILLEDNNSSSQAGGIGVCLGAVNFGAKGESKGEASAHSRMKFSVPVVLPGGYGIKRED